MYGTIIGDIAGSYKEVIEINSKNKKTETKMERYNRRIEIMNSNIPLFDKNCSYTDDTILTIAILDAILNDGNFEYYLRKYGNKELSIGLDLYGRSRFGSGFVKWLEENKQGNSYGNGCCMRLSPIGFLYNDIDIIKTKTIESVVPSHNHPDSLLCAEALSTSIYYLRNGVSKKQIYEYITKNYFSLDYDIDNLRYNYEFSSKAILSVPISFFAFLISNSFEEAIRIALSCGGDCDTIAAITGSLAEAYYGIPFELVNTVKNYLTLEYIALLDKGYAKIKKR